MNSTPPRAFVTTSVVLIAVPPMICADRDALDVAGSQRLARVQQPPLDDAAVADQFGASEQHRVHAAEGVLEGVIRHHSEALVHQRPDR